MHQVSDPSILYFGTPVVLISTLNEDDSPNLAPISSIFWLGWRCIIGISALSRTTENLLRTGEAVLNLPSVREAGAVNRLALTTGSDPVPEGKRQKGYRHERFKFEIAGLTPVASQLVTPPRVSECPVQMEASLVIAHGIADDHPQIRGKLLTMELKVVRVHLDEDILMDGQRDRVDPTKWRPLIMSFQELFGLGEKVQRSRLAGIEEKLYRSPETPGLQ